MVVVQLRSQTQQQLLALIYSCQLILFCANLGLAVLHVILLRFLVATAHPVSVTLKGINYSNAINNKIQLFLSYIVPNVPQVTLVPSYSDDNQALEKLFIITAMNQTVSGCTL